MIGVREYEHLENFRSERGLQYSDSDADAFAQRIQSPRGGAFPAGNVKLLRNAEANRARIMDEIRWLHRKANADDTVYVFFSGHGTFDTATGHAYLMPYDSDPANPLGLGLRHDRFVEDLRTYVTAKHLVVFLDACYAGAALDQGIAKSDGYDRVAASAFNRAWSDALTGLDESQMIFVSSSSGQLSWEDTEIEAGLFTHYLLLGLDGEADRSDSGDGDGTVTAGELFSYLNTEVSRHAHEQLEQRQTPVISPSYDPDFPFAIVGLPESEDLAERPVLHAAAHFPVLEDPPAELWPKSENGREALELFLEGKGVLESFDLLCAPHPEFNLTAGSDFDYNRVLKGFSLLHRSLTLVDNAWVRLYHGLALARLRAFFPALDDLERAYFAFRREDEPHRTQVTRRVLDTVQRWAEKNRREDPLAIRDPRCAAEASRTVCELGARTRWRELEGDALRAALDVMPRLFNRQQASTRSPWELFAPAKEQQRECVESVASQLIDRPQAAAKLYRLLLDDAKSEGAKAQISRYSADLYRQSANAGSLREARRFLERNRDLLELDERVMLAVADAFDRRLPAGYVADYLAVYGLVDEQQPTVEPGDAGTTVSGAATVTERSATRESTTEIAQLVVELEARVNRLWAELDQYSHSLRSSPGYDQPALSQALASITDPPPEKDEDGLAPRNADLDMDRVIDSAIEAAAMSAQALGGVDQYFLQRLEIIRLLRRLADRLDDADRLRESLRQAARISGTFTSTLAPLEQQVPQASALISASEEFVYLAALEIGLKRGEIGEGDLLLAIRRHLPNQLAADGLRLFLAVLYSLPEDVRDGANATAFHSTEFDLGDLFSRFGQSLDQCDAETDPEDDETTLAACLLRAYSRFFTDSRDSTDPGIFEPMRLADRHATAVLESAAEPDEAAYVNAYGEKLRQILTADEGKLTENQEILILLLLRVLTGDPFTILDVAGVDPDLNRLAREFAIALHLWRLNLETPAEDQLRVQARIARAELNDFSHPLAQAMLMANPLVYSGLDPDEIREFLNRSRLNAADPHLHYLAVYVAIGNLAETADGEFEKLPSYHRLEALAQPLIHDELSRFFVRYPISRQAIPYAKDIEPVVDSIRDCEVIGNFQFGLSAAEIGGVTFNASCECCAVPTPIYALLGHKAALEERWSEVEKWLSRTIQSAFESPVERTRFVSWIPWSALEDGAAPTSVLGLIHRTFDELADDSKPFDADTLRGSAGLAGVWAVWPESRRLRERDQILGRLAQVEEVLARFPDTGAEIAMTDWFDYADNLWRVTPDDGAPELRIIRDRHSAAVRRLVIAGVDGTRQGLAERARKQLDRLEEEAEDGESWALAHLGWIYLHGSEELADPTRGVELLTRAAEGRDVEAMVLLGQAYSGGVGVEPQADQAVHWLSKAAAKHSLEALYLLGEIFLEGRGGAPDRVKAFQGFYLAAEGGHREAMVQAALLCLEAGEACAAPGLVRQWLTDAARLGQAQAAELLQEHAQVGSVESDGGDDRIRTGE